MARSITIFFQEIIINKFQFLGSNATGDCSAVVLVKVWKDFPFFQANS